MAAISINHAEYKQVLSVVPLDQSVMLWGGTGIGKSESTRDFHEDLEAVKASTWYDERYHSEGFNFVDIFLGQMADAGDLIGLPTPDLEKRIMDYLPPYWWQGTRPFCIFLDEINRGRPELMQVVFDLTLNHKLAGKKLPPGSRVLAAANYGDQFLVNEMDPALIGRFNIYKLSPTAQEWTSWAQSKQKDVRVISFINKFETKLFHSDSSEKEIESGLDKNPDPRAWARVSDVIKGVKSINNLYAKIIAGIIGNEVGGDFCRFANQMMNISGKDILYAEDFDSLMIELQMMTLPDIIELQKSIYQYASVVKAPDRKHCANNFVNYFQFLTDCGDKMEASADLVKYFTEDTSGKKLQWLILDSRVSEMVSSYIANM